MEKTYTQIVSEYLAGLKYEDIPQEAIDQAKRLTLHTVGATIGGYPLPLMKRVFDYILMMTVTISAHPQIIGCAT